MPTSSTATAPRPVTQKKRRSAATGSGPRATSSRNPIPPSSSASPRKYAQRTTCSVRVGPCAPTASVTGGQHLERARQDADDLVELDADDAGRRLDTAVGRGPCVLDARVRERMRGRREREQQTDENRASHRCGAPASSERWPKIGA